MADHIHYLLRLRSSEELETLFELSDAIYQQHSEGKELVQFVAEMAKRQSMQGEDTNVNAVLEHAVALLSGDPSTAIETLATELHDYDHRALAATMLGWFGSAARSALPTLVDLASFINNASGEAHRAVLRIGGAESEVLRQLQEALTEGDDQVVRNLFALGLDLGMKEVLAFQALVQAAAQSPSVDVRDAAADQIGPQ
jgi:hypothetical protein